MNNGVPELIKGHRELWINNSKDRKWHRIDGPAYVDLTGDDQNTWWVNDKRCYSNRQYQTQAKLTDEEMTIIILKYGDVS